MNKQEFLKANKALTDNEKNPIKTMVIDDIMDNTDVFNTLRSHEIYLDRDTLYYIGWIKDLVRTDTLQHIEILDKNLEPGNNIPETFMIKQGLKQYHMMDNIERMFNTLLAIKNEQERRILVYRESKPNAANQG